MYVQRHIWSRFLNPLSSLFLTSLVQSISSWKMGLRSIRGRLEHGIHGFDWPPSSPDLNPIERVWQYMKEKLKPLPYVITTKVELKMEIQKIWDEIDPHDFWHYTECLTCIIEDVIKVKGGATINKYILKIIWFYGFNCLSCYLFCMITFKGGDGKVSEVAQLIWPQLLHEYVVDCRCLQHLHHRQGCCWQALSLICQ